MADYQIKQFDPKEYARYRLEFRYTTKSYYEIVRDPDQIFSLQLVKCDLEEEQVKSFEDTLFAGYLENPSAFAIFAGDDIAGYLEVARESWNNRLRITELLILPEYRGKGCGTQLIARAKEIMQNEGCRELILETQSCNTPAIDFYLKNGFKVNGLDLSCYSNEDIEKKEVRLEMTWK